MSSKKKNIIFQSKRDDPIRDNTPMDKIILPLPMKILAVLCVVQCVVSAPVAYIYLTDFINGINSGFFSERSGTYFILYTCFLAGMIAIISLLIAIGVNLFLNKRRTSAILANITVVVLIISTICDIMIVGITPVIYILICGIILTFVLKTYIDPSLSGERKLQSKLRDMETKKEAEEGKLGFSEKDASRPKINYFNLFWLFFIMCIVGYILEIIWHMTVDNPGVYQERAGLLFGPFSPIYGIGAVIISIALNRLTNKNFLLVFVAGALLGGFFEYFASIFLEVSFGVRSWDYSHLPFNIEGRTSLRFFIIWGLIAVVWAKIAVRPLTILINKIPWKLRYTLTAIMTAVMLVNVIMTVQALDCWYARSAGVVQDAPVEKFYAEYFNDDFMHKRFENMKMNPGNAARGEDDSTISNSQ